MVLYLKCFLSNNLFREMNILKMYEQNPAKKVFVGFSSPKCFLFRLGALLLAEYLPKKHDSDIQPSLKYNEVKLPEYLVSEEIIRNTSSERRGGMVNGKRDNSHNTSKALFSY